MQAKTKSRWRFDPDDLSVPAAIVIALGFFLVAGCFIVFGGKGHLKWGGLTLSTAVIFGYFVRDSRKFLPKPRFWTLTGSLLMLHLLAWIALLIHVERWGLLWFNIMVFELPVFWYLRGWPGLLDSSNGK
jgi:hypothetical protein